MSQPLRLAVLASLLAIGSTRPAIAEFQVMSTKALKNITPTTTTLPNPADSTSGSTPPNNGFVTLAGDPRYQAVGQIAGASGVLIAPTWVLTAGHVTAQVGGSFLLAGNTYSVVQTYVHPDFNNDGNLANDIQLVELATPVLNIVPAVLNRSTIDLTTPTPFTGTIVGYGMTGTGVTGAIASGGTKHAVTNVVDGAFVGTGSDQNPTILGTDFDNPDQAAYHTPLGSTVPTDLEGGVGPGDSGGGLFIDVPGTGTVLAGITSFDATFDDFTGNPTLGAYGHVTGFTRVAAYTGFIDGIMNPVPEPASMALMGVGVAAVLAYARGRRRRAAA